MKKNLPTININSRIILSKTKNLREITNKVLSDKISANDDSWIQRLWDWADANDIPDLDLLVWYEWDVEDGPPPWDIFPKSELTDDEYPSIKFEWWEGLPRDKNTLKSFRELNITIKDVLKGIPLEVFNLVNLEKLSIKYDFDKAIHTKYGEINNGIEFWKQRSEIENELKNNIPDLPIQIGKLKKLIELNLSKNELTMLPEEMNNLYDLKILNLSQNRLTKLPDIFHQSTLEELNLSKNELSSLPESMQNLFLLETLDLSHNQLKELPDFIDHFVSLRNLDLSGNQLLKLPMSICNFFYLDRLVIGSQDQLYPDNDDLKLTQRQRLWLFDLEENGCKLDGYDSIYEGFSRKYCHFNNKKVIWWECFDVWDDFIIQPTEFEDTNKVSFEEKENIDIKDAFLAWVDNETGLMWEVKNNRNIEDEYSWKKSFEYTSKLNSESYAGFSDWILPNHSMLISVLKDHYPILPITHSQTYWASFPFEYVELGSSSRSVDDYDDDTIVEIDKMRNEKKRNIMCVRIFDMNKALLFAAKNGLSDTVQILLNSGASVDTTDENMNTSLLIAGNRGIHLLIDAKANVNHQNKNGDTALIVVSRNNEGGVKLLLEADAEVNHQNKNGDTALILASRNNEGGVKLLLEADAEVNHQNKNGDTALIVAATYSNANILQIILDHNGLINIQNNDGNSALLLAVENILKKENLSLLNSSYVFGLSPMTDKRIKAIQILLDLDAKVNLQNNDGDTVFDLLSKVDNISTANKETIIPRIEKIIEETEICYK